MLGMTAATPLPAALLEERFLQRKPFPRTR